MRTKSLSKPSAKELSRFDARSARCRRYQPISECDCDGQRDDRLDERRCDEIERDDP